MRGVVWLTKWTKRLSSRELRREMGAKECQIVLPIVKLDLESVANRQQTRNLSAKNLALETTMSSECESSIHTSKSSLVRLESVAGQLFSLGIPSVDHICNKLTKFKVFLPRLPTTLRHHSVIHVVKRAILVPLGVYLSQRTRAS